MICNIQDPITQEDYTPRSAQRRPQGRQLHEEHRHRRHRLLRPGARVLRLRRRPLRPDASTPATTSSTASKASGTRGRERRQPNLGYKLRYKEGYFPVPPADTLQDIRNEMMLTMIECGLDVEAQHHEVATGGQCEIDMQFAPLVEMADNVMMYKYIVKNVASKHGKTATFMPKPLSRTTAPACTSTSRCGRRRQPVRRHRLRRPVRHGPVRHRRPAQARPGDLAPSPTRRPTATSGWCPATRRRSTWPTAAATARPSIRIPDVLARARRPSASSSAAPIRRAIRTSRSRRC